MDRDIGEKVTNKHLTGVEIVFFNQRYMKCRKTYLLIESCLKFKMATLTKTDKVGRTEKRLHGKSNITEYWVANKTPLK